MYALITILGLVASLITIFEFFNKNTFSVKKRLFILILLFLLITLGLVTYSFKQYHKKEAIIRDEIIQKLSLISLLNDSKKVSDSIVVTGWEEFMDYYIHLEHISAFYDRHKEIYSHENEFYKEEIKAWKTIADKLRSCDDINYNEMTEMIRRQVYAADKHIEKIYEELQSKTE